MEYFYRYRPLSIRDFEALCDSSIFYADPRKFNDPLDCSPSILVDMHVNQIKELCFHMLSRILGRDDAANKIAEIDYNLTDPDITNIQAHAFGYYEQEILNVIHKEMSKYGVVSLSKRKDSVLMWSHYANNHKGMCVEYSLEDDHHEDIREVIYENDRGIKASYLFDKFVNGNHDAMDDLINKYFYRKSKEWAYEEEWRIVSSKSVGGHNQTELEVSAIYFGMNCENHAMVPVIKFMDTKQRPLKFYKMYTPENSFELNPRKIDVDEINQFFPRMNPTKIFKRID